MLKSAFCFLKDNLGYPASLNEFLAKKPDLGYSLAMPRTADTSTITRWHEWEPAGWDRPQGELRGWQRINGQYQSVAIEVTSLSDFCSSQKFQEWKCDIRQVQVLSASKSPLASFEDLDSFAEACCHGYLDDVSPTSIARNLSHHEVRIMQPDRGDYFKHYDWDGRVCLINSGGSHHFDTARYLSKAAGHPVTLQGSLVAYQINPAAVIELNDQFAMFGIRYDLILWNELYEAMRSLQATFFLGKLPQPHNGGRVLLLPRCEKRSETVANCLIQAGFPDLGAYLLELVNNQSSCPSSL